VKSGNRIRRPTDVAACARRSHATTDPDNVRCRFSSSRRSPTCPFRTLAKAERRQQRPKGGEYVEFEARASPRRRSSAGLIRAETCDLGREIFPAVGSWDDWREDFPPYIRPRMLRERPSFRLGEPPGALRFPDHTWVKRSSIHGLKAELQTGRHMDWAYVVRALACELAS